MVRLEIKTDNDAFSELPEMEVARILRDLADRLERNGMPGNMSFHLHDLCGNNVGQAKEV